LFIIIIADCFLQSMLYNITFKCPKLLHRKS